MNAEIERFKPRERIGLPPRLIRQGLNPFKQSAREGISVDEYTIKHRGCTGHFFDQKTKKIVTVNLGYVVCHPVRLYRAASSTASPMEAVKPFEGEDAALSSVLGADEHRPQRSEDGAQDAPKMSGYVCNTRTKSHRWEYRSKNEQKNAFEWSLEKCWAETC